VWIIGLILMAQMGALMGMMGYLPLYLREIGWAPAAADSSLAVYAGISTVVTIPLTILSDRLGLRTGILVPALLISATSLGFLPAVEGAAVWALIVIMAATRSGMMALFVTLVMETEGVAGRYAGTAMGLMGTIGMLGGFLSPPLGNSLADLHIGLPFVFWAALSAVGLIGFFFVKETRGAKSEL
jgi:NNP family nitrate/nitrite transporter-like MFS transporter